VPFKKFWKDISRMFRRSCFAALLAFSLAGLAPAQDRRSRIDVDQYTIEAEISPNTQSISAKATVRFTPLDDNVMSAAFELNNSLSVSRVVDDKGKQIPASRNQQDFTVRLSFEQALPKGQPVNVTFYYDGKLTGSEDSPVYGIKFAGIHPDHAYLMYPARWFPVSGYTTDRFAALMKITVPMGFTVLGSGLDRKAVQGDKNVWEINFERPSFPGSIAVVRGNPAKISSEGVTTTLYFRESEAAMAQAYGEQVGKEMSYFTSLYGLPPYANLTVVETEDGAPNGFAAPGLLFLNPQAIGKEVNSTLLANQISRQWWDDLVSPSTRNHLWLTNGLASYGELLWTEHEKGPSAADTALHNMMTESLTVDNVPVIQAARLEDYSPELWALTGSKGAAVLSMLRYVVGDDNFFKILKAYAAAFPWRSASTEDFRKVAENASGQELNYFFIQWIESSGAPEFKLDYTIYRTQKGFRVMGKIAQDLDTFRMPVTLKIETEGNPEEKRVDVMGTSSEFSVDTFGKPKSVIIDPSKKVLRYSTDVRVAVAIRRGEQYMQLSEFSEALREYQKALETNRTSSLAHYRIAEVHFLQNNYQAAANSFREAIAGDLDPKWTEVWSHIYLGHIYDITNQRERAVNEYNLALRTKDNTQGAQEEAGKYLKTPYERQRRADQ
jgi:tetratricopeptide (TPR) repeat protein